MAKKCHIQVVCEGVETKEHVEMLREKNAILRKDTIILSQSLKPNFKRRCMEYVKHKLYNLF